MRNLEKHKVLAKNYHEPSTFSLSSQTTFFWFDLFLIFGSLVVLGGDFFHILEGLPDMAVLIVASAAGLLPVIYNAIKSLFKRHLSIDLLASIALVFSLAAREWQSAVFISLMLASARIFARYTSARAKNAVSGLMKLRPLVAHRLVDGRPQEVKIDELKIGDLVLIESGERAAVDGQVQSGTASLDQSSLTGESEPVLKSPGDEIFSSTLNLSGSLVVKASRVGGETMFAKILDLVGKSQASKIPIATTVDRFASWYIFATLVGTILLYSFTKNLALVLSVLLVTCADDLAVALPLSFSAAIASFAKRGIIIKGGQFLEGLTKIKTIIFDKTGTITTGKPEVKEVVTFDNFPPEKFLAILGAVESESEHPAAKAMQEYINSKKINLPKINKVHEEPGFGIKGILDDREVLSGKTKFLKDNGTVFTDEQSKLIEEQKIKERTVTTLSLDKKPIGFIAMMDAIRPAASEVMHELKNLGVEKLIIMTGDNEKIAADVAKHVGISEFKANLLPQDKINYLKQMLNPQSKVAMVGDGVNDAASLALADVGIAMGVIGSDAAVETADIVLMKDNLKNIPEAIKASRFVMKVVRQDLWIWGIVNFVGLILVFNGVLEPRGAAAYNFLTDFLPLFNSMRIFKAHFKNKK